MKFNAIQRFAIKALGLQSLIRSLNPAGPEAGIAQWFTRGDDWPGRRNALTDPYAQHPTIHRAIKVLADAVEGIPFELFRGDEDTPVPDTDPVARTFALPSGPDRYPRLSGARLFGRTTRHMFLSGNSLWRRDSVAQVDADPGRGSFPTRLWPLDPKRVVQAVTVGEDLVGFKYRQRAGTVTIPIEELVHFSFDNPNDAVWGLAEVAPILAEAQTDHEAALSNRRMLKRGGPGMILERDSNAAAYGEEEDERFEDQMDQEFTGDDEHTSVMLPPGVKANTVGATQKDMLYQEQRRWARELIGGSLGSVPSAQGVLEYANYANMGKQLEQLYNLTVFPMLSYYENVVQTELLDRFNTGMKGYFKREAVRALIQDMTALSVSMGKFLDAGVPFAEVNDRLELGFDTDESKYPWMHKAFVPMNRINVEDLMEPPVGSTDEDDEEQPAPFGSKPTPDDDDDEGSGGDEEGGEEQRVVPFAERHRAVLWQSVIRSVNDLEAAAFRATRSVFNDALTEMAAEVRKGKGADAGFNESRATERMRKKMAPIEKKGVERGGDKAMREVKRIQGAGPDAIQVAAVDFNVLHPAVLKYLKKKIIKLKEPVQALRRDAKRFVALGIEAGDSAATIAKSLRSVDAFNTPARAMRIARTETVGAFNNGREFAFDQAEVEKVEWLTARDGKVRAGHQIDGEQVKRGEEFSNGLKHPHDPDGAAGDVINCRCVALPA